MAGVNKTDATHSCLDHLSIEELEGLLNQEMESIAFDDSNTGYALQIMEVIEKRREKELPDEHDVDAAWESFKENYLPFISCDQPIYDWDADEETYLRQRTSHNQQKTRSSKHRTPRVRLRLLPHGAIAALTFIIVVAVLGGRDASGATRLQSMLRWGMERFGFMDAASPAPISEALVSLHDALAEHGIADTVAPTWIPEGFETVLCTVMELEAQTAFMTQIKDIDRELIIQIVLHKETITRTFEKSDEDITEYKRNSINHYITDNEGSLTAAWEYMNYECYIAGDITISELIKTIDSIYER